MVGKPLAAPTEAEIRECVRIGHEVVAFAADDNERCLFLKMACANGDEAVVWLDAIKADQLFRHLEFAFTGAETDPEGGSRLRFVKPLSKAYGKVPRSPARKRP